MLHFLRGTLIPLSIPSAMAAFQPHVITVGPARRVTHFVGLAEDKIVEVAVRAAHVEAKLMEFINDTGHDTTDRFS